jgi:iron complex transport system permease protein
LIIALVRQEGISNAVIWLMGDLSSAAPQAIFFTGLFVIIGILALILLGRDVDVICLGEEKAQHAGLNVAPVKKTLFFIASLIAGACVSSSGIIGFVGLIIPHIARFLFGVRHRVLFIAVSFLGAGFLLICDTLARTIVLPMELPVGVITGIFGGIFFLSILLGSKKWEIM